MTRIYYRGIFYIALLALCVAEKTRSDMPILGAKSKAKAEWIRGWMGVKDKEIVTCAEVKDAALALSMRGIVAETTLFPLAIIALQPVDEQDTQTKSKTNGKQLLERWQALKKRGKSDLNGLINDIKTVGTTLPQSCVEALMGNINQAPPVHSRAKRVQVDEISGEVPVGLLVRERSSVVLRDRINWKLPPGPGANLRIRDILQYGDQLELEFRNRDSSEQYRFRGLMPTVTTKHRDIGLEIAGQFRRDDATFVWDGETEASARRRCAELSAMGRFYIGNEGNFMAFGQRLAQIGLANSEEFDEDWERFDGLYSELVAKMSWRYDPRDYDPDTLFAPGYGAEITLRMASQYLGAPTSYEILKANYRRTTLLADDLFWDLEVVGYLGENVPQIMLPTMGGNGTVRGHSSVMSVDRMVCLQQTLRRSFQWRHDTVFTPSALFDIGWASQKSLENERRAKWLEGVGAGIRWDFPALYGFKMFETTFAQGIGGDSGWKVDVRTRFEF